MYRRVVVFSSTLTSSPIKVLYHVYGARLLSQQRVLQIPYNATFDAMETLSGVRFSGSYLLKFTATIVGSRTYEFIMDVSENQPAQESVEEISTSGVYIAVYNENGVLVCDNGKRSSISTSDLNKIESTGAIKAPGEMTSVPGEEPGEMAGETTDEAGAMI